MYRNKCHLGEFVKRSLEPDQGPMMSLSFTADQLMTKRFRGGLPSADVRKTTLVHDQGEVPVTFDHLALCFVPLDVVPRAHFSRQGVLQSDEIRVKLLSVMRMMVAGYAGTSRFTPLDDMAPYQSKLWPIMQNMMADIKRIEGWIAREQRAPSLELTDPDYGGAVANPEPKPKPPKVTMGMDPTNIIEGTRERKPAIPRSDLFSTGDMIYRDPVSPAVPEPEEFVALEAKANPYAWKPSETLGRRLPHCLRRTQRRTLRTPKILLTRAKWTATLLPGGLRCICFPLLCRTRFRGKNCSTFLTTSTKITG